MAVRKLVKDTPDRASVTTAQQAFSVPATGAHGPWWVRIYSTAECYFIDTPAASDTAALGTVYQTVPAGVYCSFSITGATFAVAGSTSQTVQVVVRS